MDKKKLLTCKLNLKLNVINYKVFS